MKQQEKVVFSVGPYPFITVKLGLYFLTLLICFGESTSPPVNKYFTPLKIFAFSSQSVLNNGAVSHIIEILFFSI